MALKIRQNTVVGKASAVVYDTTCKFDSGYNESGYGGPNPSADPNFGSFVSSNIKVFPPGDTVGIDFNPFPYLPNEDSTGIEITVTDLGLTSMPIGVWKFVYTATTSTGDTYETTCYAFNTCEVNCCIDSKVLAVDPLCDPERFAQIAHLERLLESANSAFCKGDYDKANKILSYVNEQCNCCC